MSAAESKNIILLYESEAIFNRFRQVFGHRYQIFWGKDLNTAMDVLAEHNVGVIICDIHFQDQEIYPVVLALKLQYPSLVTMIVSQSEDADKVAELEAQEEIFAALVRPIKQKALNDTLDKAFAYYLEQVKAEVATMQIEELEGAVDGSPFAGMSLIEALAAKSEINRQNEMPNDIQDDIQAHEDLETVLADIMALKIDTEESSHIGAEQEDGTEISDRNPTNEDNMECMFFEDIEDDE